MESVYTEKYKNCLIKIEQDTDYSDDYMYNEDLECFLVHYHRDLEVKRDIVITDNELRNYFAGEKIEAQKDYHIFAVKSYIHSGISLALEESGRMYPDEGWDVSHCGAVLVSKKEYKDKQKAYKRAEALIETWNDDLSGNVYGFTTEDEENGIDIDSCWGFYGNYEKSGIIDEAKASIDNYIKNEREKAKEKTIDNATKTLGTFLASENETIRRHAIGILKQLNN